MNDTTSLIQTIDALKAEVARRELGVRAIKEVVNVLCDEAKLDVAYPDVGNPLARPQPAPSLEEAAKRFAPARAVKTAPPPERKPAEEDQDAEDGLKRRGGRRPETRDAIEAFLREHGASTVPQIAEGTGLEQMQVRKCVSNYKGTHFTCPEGRHGPTPVYWRLMEGRSPE